MKYGVVIPDATRPGEYVAFTHCETLEEAEQAFAVCPFEGKAIVRYDRIGPCTWIGITIKE